MSLTSSGFTAAAVASTWPGLIVRPPSMNPAHSSTRMWPRPIAGTGSPPMGTRTTWRSAGSAEGGSPATRSLPRN
jgi:hypothetical protein